MEIVDLESRRRFDTASMAKNNLFETRRFFCDLYCLEAGQAQKPHAHAGEDKVMFVLEGTGKFLVGGDVESVKAGQGVIARAGEPHGLSNEGPDRLVVLVFMAPHPRLKED